MHDAAALGWFNRLDRAGDEAGGADALKELVAREIIGPGPQRRERRLQARFQLDEAADIGCGALSHGEPHAIELSENRGASICVTRNTKRSVGSRMSRVSTKRDSETE